MSRIDESIGNNKVNIHFEAMDPDFMADHMNIKPCVYCPWLKLLSPSFLSEASRHPSCSWHREGVWLRA